MITCLALQLLTAIFVILVFNTSHCFFSFHVNFYSQITTMMTNFHENALKYETVKKQILLFRWLYL